MIKIYLFVFCLLGLSFQIYSQSIDSTSKNYKNSFEYHFKNKGFQNYQGININRKELKPWGSLQGRGSIVNLGILGCVDSYGIPGWGVELGISSIRMNGLTGSLYMGGASNQIIWFGGGIGYTHRMQNFAPYGLLGGALAYSDEEGEILLTVSLEFGAYRRITNWFSVKAALRSSLGQNPYDYEFYNFNVLVFSLVIDKSRQIPYW